MYNYIKNFLNYFFEPYQKYDGNWKGIIHYEALAERRLNFKIILIVIAVFSIVFTAVKYF